MKPLAGVRVVVTRAAHQAEELARPLREYGAEVILLPLIGIAPPSDPSALRAAAMSDSYDWVVFTSANAVSIFSAELLKSGRQCRAQVAAIGKATAEASEAAGFRVGLVPERYVAEALVEAFAGQNLSGVRFLVPSAALTRDVVAAALRGRGASVDVVEAYRNVMPSEAEQQAQVVFQAPYPDWVTVASSSAVTNLVNLVGVDVLQRARLATIGPITSETARNLGLSIAAETRTSSVEGLVQAIIDAQLH